MTREERETLRQKIDAAVRAQVVLKSGRQPGHYNPRSKRKRPA